MNQRLQVAIDGPAAAGKSTVAKQVAGQLEYIYIDTGAMYRALAYHALKTHTDLHNGERLSELLDASEITLEPVKQGRQTVLLNGEDVTKEIRSQSVTNHVSLVAQYPAIRQVMADRQREMAAGGGIIMDGRDIGSHVLPNAEVKIYLIASVNERAERRYQEQLAGGLQTSLEQLKADIRQRDKLDSEREVSPLIKAEDAVEIDTTSLSINDVILRILEVIKERV
ncbi:(d)CMP kinase [Tuberibacillus sp. Marseille-P3662]|uniref:(d)CMP kinase n=1 Tax=Tuberibacillus sp. Marseille-P3662 TaxID=1965358 RepID=UPI000A1C952C|nr:(d)CMP kinase [Tuberibacillus sp. Marseille-P3662]